MIELASTAVGTILAEAPASEDGRETGAILLGHDLGERIRVTVAGTPGPAAIRTVNRFKRDLDHARRLADRVYTCDGSIWIGEWHTHPRGPAEPSARDLTTYHDLLADTDLGFARIVGLIVTPCPACGGWGHPPLRGWIVSTLGARRATVTVSEEDADA